MTRNPDPREVTDTSVKRRQPQALNHSSAKRLLAYAGVGAAVACAPAQAEVIYTPVHRSINLNFAVDLNHDGIIDFNITSSGYSEIYYLSVKAIPGNRIAATHNRPCSLH